MVLANRYTKTQFTSCDDFYENYQLTVPAQFNFGFDVIDEMAAHAGDGLAMLWCNEQGAERRFTFRQMKEASDKAANFFRDHGIGKGDPVMLILKRRYEYWFCVLALHKLGAIAVPATHLLTEKDLVYRNQAADIKMIVCVNDQTLLGSLTAAASKSPSVKTLACLGETVPEGFVSFDQEFEKASADFVRGEAVCNDDIMLLYFTSGTTGLPKMVAHNYVYPLAHIVTAAFWHGMREDSIHLTVADTGWAKAAWGKLYGQWLMGGTVFVYDYDRFVAAEMLALIAKYKITNFCAPPTIYRFMIKEDISKVDLSSLRHVSVAGEPLNPEVYHQFKNATGLKLMECYGQTEATPMLITPLWMEPKPGSMGKPSPHYHIRLVDEDGNDVEAGDEGQIVIDTSQGTPVGLFQGYYRDDERTHCTWHDGLYFTGDMAWRDEDGYYWFIGRSDDVIKSSGYRIGPFEVESALMEHPAVLECAITGVPDEDRGTVVKATVVLAKGYDPSPELKKALQEHVKKVTAPYKYPRILEFVTELPKTISGKTRRVQIREEDRNRYYEVN